MNPDGAVPGLPVTSSSVSNWMEPAAAHAGEVRKLSTLLETSQALSSTLDLKEGLQRVLEILGRHHGAIRSTVVLLAFSAITLALSVWASLAMSMQTATVTRLPR